MTVFVLVLVLPPFLGVSVDLEAVVERIEDDRRREGRLVGDWREVVAELVVSVEKMRLRMGGAREEEVGV